MTNNNTVRIVDVETTGLDHAEDKIVEIAKVDWTDGEIGAMASDLINPGRDIPAQAKAIHHITKEDVEGKPSFDDVAGQYSTDGIVAAHNADFDRGFLGEDFATHWICTYKASLRVWPDLPSHSNQFLRYHLNLPNPPEQFDGMTLFPHRALYDAFVTAHLFNTLIQHMTAKEMVEISREPALMSVFTFGKHRGEKYSEVPSDYLEWLIANHDDESVKFSAHHALRGE